MLRGFLHIMEKIPAMNFNWMSCTIQRAKKYIWASPPLQKDVYGRSAMPNYWETWVSGRFMGNGELFPANALDHLSVSVPVRDSNRAPYTDSPHVSTT